MARYYDVQPDLRLTALDLAKQLRPGTFEYALAYLIDQELDLTQRHVTKWHRRQPC